jgi:hypothetical protein
MCCANRRCSHLQSRQARVLLLCSSTCKLFHTLCAESTVMYVQQPDSMTAAGLESYEACCLMLSGLRLLSAGERTLATCMPSHTARVQCMMGQTPNSCCRTSFLRSHVLKLVAKSRATLQLHPAWHVHRSGCYTPRPF